jgi:hypothetical protein
MMPTKKGLKMKEEMSHASDVEKSDENALSIASEELIGRIRHLLSRQRSVSLNR